MRKYTAEFIGTLVLVLFGCGSVVVAGEQIGYLGIALTFGLVIVALTYAIGPVSGCHVNPAVSFAMLLSGKLSGKDFAGYVVAQVAGALAGSGLLYAILSSTGKTVTALGQNGFGAGNGLGVSSFMAVIVEAILTTVFIYTILGVTSKDSNSAVAGLIIGLSLTVIHLFGIGLTGASVNPARSLGPAIWLGGTALSQVWVYIVAPLIGAALAVGIFTGLNKKG